MATSWSSVIRIRAIASIGFRWPFTGIEAIRIFIGSILQVVGQHAAGWRRGCSDCERGWGDPVTSRLQASRKWLQLQRVIALPTQLRAAAWTVDGKACRSEESEARFALLDFYNIAVGIAHVAARLAALVHWLGNKLRSSTSPEFIGPLNIGNAENHKAAD